MALTCQLTRREPKLLGQDGYRKIAGQVRRHVVAQVTQPIARSELEAQRLRKLLLAALALHVDDELARHRKRPCGAEIFFDQRQRKVDATGHAGRRVEAAVFDEQLVVGDTQLGEALRDVGREVPVSSDATAVEQPGRRQPVDAGAHRGNPSQLARTLLDEAHDFFVGRRLA